MPEQSSQLPKVAFITREMNSYRIPFFESAFTALSERGVHFDVYVGGATEADRSKGDDAVLSWAKALPTKELHILGQTAWWQNALDIASEADLVITEQATKQLTNVPLSLMQRSGRVRHCLWGHGENFQRSIDGGTGEGVKKWLTRPAHWFFSYTSASTAVLIQNGFPPDRITTFNNSTDVEGMRSAQASISESDLRSVRSELGFADGPVVGYLGGLYGPKRIQFLLDSLSALRQKQPTASAIIIGGGSDESLVRAFAADRPWVHCTGPMYGPDRLRLALSGELLLMPGLVGLNIVDGFALCLPTVTTSIDYHSPEIAYLRHGENGWICDGDVTPDGYAAQVSKILDSPKLLAKLKAGAKTTGDMLGIESMAERFADGVVDALEAPNRS